MTKNCIHCGTEFSKKSTCSVKNWEKTKLCSSYCHNGYRRGKSSPSPATTFKKGHILKHNNHLKGGLNKLWKGGKVDIVCKACSATFKVDRNQKEKAKNCSVQCYNVYRKSVEFRVRLSTVQKVAFKKRYGNLQIVSRSFDKLIRQSVHYRLWRETIFLRDNFTCQMCNQRGGSLQADHIKQFALIILQNEIKTFEEAVACDELWDTKNGRTLCLKCHLSTDTYGQKIIK